jgi:GNAT superfamily N-acetyltransferase
MLAYPLSRHNRIRLARAFAAVPRVDISIECALEDQMGRAFVDSAAEPRVFLIEQDQFFCYLAGDFTSETGGAFLSAIPSNRFLMAGTPGWQDAARAHYGERLRPVLRYSYSAETLAADPVGRLAAGSAHAPKIRRVDAALAGRQTPYLALGAFDSPEDFVERGIGFCLVQDDQILGGAYSSLANSHAIEVSIVVDPKHQRQGVATALAAHLLQWCLAHHVRPSWDAANAASCNLAEKLGYRKTGEYTAYYLK